MDLDSYNNLHKFPLDGIDDFIAECKVHDINRIIVTATDTDPMLYTHTVELREYLAERIPDLQMIVQTNGVAVNRDTLAAWECYDEASLHICSFDPMIYNYMMGRGAIPNVQEIMNMSEHMKDVRLSITLSNANKGGDLYHSFRRAQIMGIKRVILVEPWGQPHIGDPFAGKLDPTDTYLGMPVYTIMDVSVLYWDLASSEANSVNLFADGKVTVEYPIVDVSKYTFLKEERRKWEQWMRTPSF